MLGFVNNSFPTMSGSVIEKDMGYEQLLAPLTNYSLYFDIIK